MEAIILIGRVVYALIFVASGAGHLAQLEQTGAYAEAFGVKPGKPAAAVSGVAMLAGGLGVVLGVWMDLALLGLAALLLIMAVAIHPFWKMEGQQQQAEMAMFMKNVSMAGAAIALFGFIAGTGYDAQTITGPLFEL